MTDALLAFDGVSFRHGDGFELQDINFTSGAGVRLAGHLSVIIALAEFGVQIGVIDDGLEAGAILLVGVTAVYSPIVFRMVSPPLTASETDLVEEAQT